MRIRAQVTDFGRLGHGVEFAEDGTEIITEYSYITLAFPMPADHLPEHIDPNKYIIVDMKGEDNAG